MLVFKVAKFALRHPLLTHSASRLLHKKLRPKKEASPMKQKVRICGTGPASGAPVQAL